MAHTTDTHREGAEHDAEDVDTVAERTIATRAWRDSAEVVAAAMVAAWQQRLRPAEAGPLHRV